MKNYKRGIIVFFCLLPMLSMAQSMRNVKPGVIDKTIPIIDYASDKIVNTRVPFKGDLEALKAGRLNGNAVFDVTYIGFNPEQQAAFQYAVDIWSSLLQSDVPIRLQAKMSFLDPGVLGQAGPDAYYTNFDNAQKVNTIYPVALAEKIAGHDLNNPEDPDISMEFNTNFDWYYGLDGNPSSSQFDYVTIILHEIAHGLGFIANSFVTADGTGFHSTFTVGPSTYASNLETANGANVVETFTNGTIETGDILTGGQLFWNSFTFPTAGERPSIFAPDPWDGGSSVSHLDDATYPSGSANSLMTPFASRGEVVHDPGLTLDMFEDMGWIGMQIDFLRILDSEDSLTNRTITATVKGDNAIITDGVNLHYTYSDFSSEVVVNMTATGNVNEFTAVIPATGFEEQVSYFINVDDDGGRTFTSPGEAPNFFWEFNMAVDKSSPTIDHNPVDIVFLNNPILPIVATVTDNIGVGDLKLNYKVNDGMIATIIVPLLNSSIDGGSYEGEYLLEWDLGPLGLVAGDLIEYTLEVQDLAAVPNVTINPSKDEYIIRAEDLETPVLEYENNFNSSSDDFDGSGFRIGSETDFNNNAIHSDHPYRTVNGATDADSLTLIYLLRKPIIISEKNPSLVFDEVVLIEPGDPGTVYGADEFWDYAVVEGSKDFGSTWLPIEDGYDSRAEASWLARYNSNVVDNNSEATGDEGLYIEHEMDLTSSGDFAAGDTLLVRYRMYIDPFAHGWGWAIDNLKIQIDDEAPVISQIAPSYMFVGDTQISLDSRIEDKSGLDSVVYEVDFNGQTQIATYPGTANLFTFNLTFPELKEGDVLKYRIIAVDSARVPNTAILPETGFFEIPVVVLGEAKSMYVNDFNSPTDDFIGSNFSVTQPNGFDDAAIVSISPYTDAPVDAGEMYYLLKNPITLNTGTAWAQYDEVVLTEPGNDKVAFDVSKDNGATWIPVFDPYAAGEEAVWFNTFNTFDKAGNSLGVGESSMYVNRIFNMLENPELSGGEEVLVRFRMTVNENVHGWGWAIDNLEIQGLTTSIEDDLSTNIQVYPNPSNTGSIILEANLVGSNSQTQITDVMGKVVLSKESRIINNSIKERLDVSHLRKGIYIISVSDNAGVYTRRVVID